MTDGEDRYVQTDGNDFASFYTDNSANLDKIASINVMNLHNNIARVQPAKGLYKKFRRSDMIAVFSHIAQLPIVYNVEPLSPN